jgi:DNA-binding CsgD family transcriptional regulator/tetratricopeptide (TPR) repeat protein
VREDTNALDREAQVALLERDSQLAVLIAASKAAAAGRSSTVLLTGEAGIGKTSLVRAFTDALPASVRVLSGACDDLLMPRTLGPLRDAAAGTGGPLERALAVDAPTEVVLGAAVEELRGPRPTVLIVEDIHWADDATLDVLRFFARRLGQLTAVLVLTFRTVAGPRELPLQQLLGALTVGRVHRLALPALSAAAVGTLASGSGRDATALHTLTGGNPFYVTEALAAPPDALPVTVVDTVLARVRRLGPEARAACEQLAVVPSHAGFDLAAVLFGTGLDALTEAEEHGIVEVWAEGVAFRHELARRAIESALPALRRRNLNRAVVAALRDSDHPDLARLVHHAVRAHNAPAVLAYAPLAGRQAAQAGSHRQALAHFEAALRYAQSLPAGERAALTDDYAWELHIAHRFADAVRAGQEAVALREQLGDPVALGESLLRLSRHLYLAGHTDDAEAAIESATQVLAPTGSAPALASATTYRGAILALTGRSTDAIRALEHARSRAADSGRTDLAALCLNYLGIARADLGDPAGLQLLRDSLATATTTGDHESTARAYTNLAELLYRDGHWDQLARHLDTGLAFTRERGFWSHAYNLDVHQALLYLRRGDWTTAERRLRDLVHGVADPGMLYVYSAPALARVLLRRGDPDTEPLLAAAWERAQSQRLLLGLAYAGIAYLEWAWLTGQPERAIPIRDTLLARTELAGTAAIRGELLRYLARAGLGGKPFDGCPEPWAAGLRGDWRAAASAWDQAGDPYEQALELGESGEVEPTLHALHILDHLGATPTATLVRRRLRNLGVRQVPRGVLPSTRANPAGLTTRQVDVLTLVTAGLTNAEIAEKLIVSVRTVDHHVSAILTKLGVSTRHQAAKAASTLGLTAMR